MQAKYLITLLMTFLFSLTACADSSSTDTIPVPSSWVNGEGSTLSITAVDAAGQITGIYINRAVGYNCQDVVYPVTGWIYGTAITFDTKWESQVESCNSITSWAGFLYENQLSTLYNLTQNGSTSATQIIQGEDTFKQAISSAKKSSIIKK